MIRLSTYSSPKSGYNLNQAHHEGTRDLASPLRTALLSSVIGYSSLGVKYLLPFTSHSNLKRWIDVSVHVCMNYSPGRGRRLYAHQHSAFSTMQREYPSIQWGENSFRIMGSTTINQWPPNSKSEAPTCAVVPIMEPTHMPLRRIDDGRTKRPVWLVKASKAFRGRCCFPVKLASGEREILNRAECHLDRPLLPSLYQSSSWPHLCH